MTRPAHQARQVSPAKTRTTPDGGMPGWSNAGFPVGTAASGEPQVI